MKNPQCALHFTFTIHDDDSQFHLHIFFHGKTSNDGKKKREKNIKMKLRQKCIHNVNCDLFKEERRVFTNDRPNEWLNEDDCWLICYFQFCFSFSCPEGFSGKVCEEKLPNITASTYNSPECPQYLGSFYCWITHNAVKILQNKAERKLFKSKLQRWNGCNNNYWNV
jgi:hypothetical protein